MPMSKDPSVLANCAISISRAATLLENAVQTDAQNGKSAFAQHIGTVILRAYSVEVLLKSLHVFVNPNRKYPKGHKLDELFNTLPSDSIKSALREAFLSLTQEELDDFLDDHSRSFVDWRYLWESKANLNFSMSKMNVLAGILSRILEALIKPRDKSHTIPSG